MLGCSATQGATLTWTGSAGGGSVSTAGNWSPTQAPVNGDSLIFAGSTSLAPQLTGALSVGAITFNSTAGAFVLGGAGVYTVGASGITNNSSNLETIDNGIVLGADQTWTASNGALTVTGAINTSGRVLTIAGALGITLRGVISDTGSIVKNGAGTLTLSGANTYTGSTSLNAGTIVIGNNTAFGTGALLIDGGTLQGDGTARTISNDITLTAGATIGGTSNLTFNGNFLQSGGSRTLTVSNTGLTTFAGPMQLTATGRARTLTISSTGDVVISGVISNGVGAGGLIKTGTGTLTLSGANTHTGTTRVTTGTLILANNTAAGTGTLSLGGGTLQSGLDGLTIANATKLAADSTMGGTRDITFTGAFTNSGGNRTLTVTNTALTTLAGSVNLSNSKTARTWTVAGTGNLTISSVIRNGSTATTGNLTMAGTGTLTLSGTSANTYSGTTTVSAGTVVLAKSAGNAIPGALTIGTGTSTVRLAASNQIADSSVVSVNTSGVLDVSTFQDTIGSLTGSGSVQLGTGGVLTTGANGGTTTYSGVMSGTGSLVKTGTGTFTISGTNTYSGGTTVEGGSLTLGKAGAIASTSAVTVTGTTSTLNLSTFANTFASFTLTGGTVSGTGLATLNGDVTATSSGGTAATISAPLALATGTHTFTINSGGATSDLNITSIISGAGNLVKAGVGSMTLSGVNTYTGSTTINAGTLNLSGGSAIADTGAVILADAAGAVLAVGSAGETIGSLSGGGTTGGTVTIAGGALTISGSSTTTYAGAISGAGGITKAGTGVQILSGVNTYSGATTINAGTLRVSGGSAISDSSTVTTANVAGAVLDLAGSNETIGGLAGGGTTGGGVTLGTGTLSVGASNATTAYAGIISGTGGLTKVGTGTLTLSAAQTFSGALTVNGGTLTLSGSATAASATSVNLGTGGTLTLDNSTTENTSRLSSTVAIALNGGTLSFISDNNGTSENFGSLVPSSGASTISITHNGSTSNATVMTFSSLGTIGSGATVNFAATGGTLGASANGPQVYITGQSTGFMGGWATVGSNFAEYSTFGVRAVTGYYTGPLGINVNDPAQIVLLNSSSLVAAYTLTNIGTTKDSGLNIVDAALVDLGTVNTNILNLVSGGLLKSSAVNTTISGQGRLTSGGTASGSLSATVVSTGTLTISATIINNAGVDGTYGNGDDGIVSLSKSGTGTLTLSGSNTFSGNVVINGGILQAATEANLGAASNDVTFNNGTLALTSGFTASINKVFKAGAGLSGTLDIAAAQTLTLGDAADVFVTADTAGTFFKKGTGTLVVQNANPTFDGKLQIDAGIVELRNAQSLGDVVNRGTISLNSGTLNLRGNAATDFLNAVTVLANSTIDVGRISGTSPSVALTLGTLSIGANTLTVSGSNATLGFGAVTLTGNATLSTGMDTSVGSISGAFNLTKTGTGVLSTSGTSTLTGTTTVSTGTLRFGAANTRLASSALTVSSGAIFDLNSFSGAVGSLAGSGNVTFGSGTLEVGLDNTSTTFSGVASGTGGFLKSGTGTFILGASNTYTGATTVNGGTLRISAAERIANASAVVIGSGGTLDLNSFGETVASIAGSGRVTLGTGTLSVTGSTSTTFSGVISGTGSGGLTKAGTGTLTLSGASTYTGVTSITAGIIEIQNIAALGDTGGGTTVAAGSELRLNGDLDIGAEALTLSGTGASGSGALHSLLGTSSWAGAITLAADSTIGVDADSLTLSGNVTKGTYLLTFTGHGDTTVTGVIAGTGSNGILKAGDGQLTLNADNTYAGLTSVTAGIVSVQTAAALGATGAGNGTQVSSGAVVEVTDDTGIDIGAEAITLNGDGVGSHGALRSTVGVNSWAGAVTLASNTTIGVDADSLTLSGAIGDGGSAYSLTKVGAGSLALSGSATYTGATRINEGTLEIDAAERIHDSSAVTIVAGAVLDLNDFSETIGSLSGAGSVTLGDVTGGTLTMGGNNSSTSYSGVISGLGPVVKTGTGTLTLTGANTFTGNFTIQGGTVAINANAALGNGSSLILSGGTLRSLNALTVSRPINILAAGGTLDTNGFATSVSSVISGAGALTKIGADVLTLSAANTYSGNTTISAGSIKISNVSALPSGPAKAMSSTMARSISTGSASPSMVCRAPALSPTARLARPPSRWAPTIKPAPMAARSKTAPARSL